MHNVLNTFIPHPSFDWYDVNTEASIEVFQETTNRYPTEIGRILAPLQSVMSIWIGLKRTAVRHRVEHFRTPHALATVVPVFRSCEGHLPPTLTLRQNRPISDIRFTSTDQTTQKDAPPEVNFGLQAPFSVQKNDCWGSREKVENR